MADDIPAPQEGSPTRAAPVTVTVSPAAGNKLTEAVDRIVGIWREHRDGPGLLQIVFHDPGPGDEDLHGELREQLAARGLPLSAIRLAREISEPVGDTASVLITSTDGADIAAAVARGRDVAVHHLDVPRGAFDAQRRAQAATEATSRSFASFDFRYLTTGTPDRLRWEALDRKEAFEAFIAQVRAGVPVGEDPGESPISYSELKALAGGGAGLVAGGLSVPSAVVAEIFTEDGEITLPAGSGTGDVSAAAARHLVNLVKGHVQRAGTPSFNSATGTLTVPIPGGTVTLSAQNVTGRAPGGDPLTCLARSLQSVGVPTSVQLPRRPHARLWGVGTNIQDRLPALEYPQASPFRPDSPAPGRPVNQARRAAAARPVRPPRQPGR